MAHQRARSPGSTVSGHDAMISARATRLWLIAYVLTASHASATVVEVPGVGASTIQQGLDVASAGDSVVVAPGVYTGFGNRDLDFNGKAITLMADGPAASVTIDCEYAGSAVRFQSDDHGPSIVSGFVITRAPEFAVLASGAGNVKVTECVFTENQGGACVVASDATLEVTGCVFEDNDTRGIFAEASAVIIRNSMFRGNRDANGAGGTFVYCELVAIEECVFSGNAATQRGGALYFDGSWNPGAVTGCTIVGNSAGEVCGGVYLHAGQSLAFERTILRDNCAPEPGVDLFLFDSDDLNSVSMTCCALSLAGICCEGQEIELIGAQVEEKPQFCDPMDCGTAPTSSGDYRLAPSSPCTAAASPCGEWVGANLGLCLPAGAPVANLQETHRIRVLPNPSRGAFSIETLSVLPRASELVIISANGRIARRVGVEAGESRWEWDGLLEDGRSAPNGVYFLSIPGVVSPSPSGVLQR